MSGLNGEQGKKGKVYLIGAGPGDPKLITIRGREAIERADAVVYDRLASPRLLKYMKPGAECIYVGKLPDRHTLKQEVISQMLVDLAMQGKTVARLKGGDPAVFGRVGEEAELLAEHGIEFEWIPGVTSAFAVPAYAGIPVTHRDFTSSLAIVTGHECPVKKNDGIDWEKLATATGTLIFLMGVGNIVTIREVLLEKGRSLDTPVAIVRWGTTAEQRTLVGTLETIVDQVRESGLKSPAVIVVGEVVKLREKLAWYEKKPLFGKRVLVTRSRGQASELAEMIDEMGGEAIELPVIQIQPPSEPEAVAALDRALYALPDYDWVLFTSVNGVEYFFQRLKKLRLDVRSMHRARIAAVGPKTAEALLERGLLAEMLPSQFYAEQLLEAISPHLQRGQRILLPRADIARAVLPIKLRELGMDVTEVEVYETVPAEEDAAEAIRLLQSGELHFVTFTSSSTVRNLLNLLVRQGVADPVQLVGRATIVCIGPITAQTAREAGLRVDCLAERASVASLVDAIIGNHAETI